MEEERAGLGVRMKIVEQDIFSSPLKSEELLGLVNNIFQSRF